MYRTGGTTIRRLPQISLLLSLAIAVLLGTMLIQDVDAKGKSPGSYQNAFTNACRNNGGTPQRVRSRVVKCTLGDGTVITCDFNTNPPSCTTVRPAAAGSPTAGGGIVADPSGVAEQPWAPVGGAAPGGGVGGVDPGWGAAQPGTLDSGGGIVLTAADDDTHDQAKRHGKHRRQGHGKGRKG